MKTARGFTLISALLVRLRRTELPDINVQPRGGFTLIELLVVIALVIIMAAAVLMIIKPGKRTSQARDSTRQSDIGQIANALRAYYTIRETYPGPSGPANSSGLTALTASGDLKSIPVDPLGHDYQYTVSGFGIGAEAAIYVTLEDPSSGSGNWMWCFRTENVEVFEVTSSACLP